MERDARPAIFPTLRQLLYHKRREIRGALEDEATSRHSAKNVIVSWRHRGLLVYGRGWKVYTRLRRGGRWEVVKINCHTRHEDGNNVEHQDVEVGRDFHFEWAKHLPESGTPREIPASGAITPLPVPDLSRKPQVLPPTTPKQKRLVAALNVLKQTYHTDERTQDGWTFWTIHDSRQARPKMKSPAGVIMRTKAQFMDEIGLLEQPALEW